MFAQSLLAALGAVASAVLSFIVGLFLTPVPVAVPIVLFFVMWFACSLILRWERDGERAKYKLLSAFDEEQKTPDATLKVELDEPVRGSWLTDDEVELAIRVRIRNQWIYPYIFDRLVVKEVGLRSWVFRQDHDVVNADRVEVAPLRAAPVDFRVRLALTPKQKQELKLDPGGTCETEIRFAPVVYLSGHERPLPQHQVEGSVIVAARRQATSPIGI